MSRLHQALIAGVVVQLILIAWVFWPHPASGGGSGAPVLGDLKPEDVAAFTITDEQGQRIKVARTQGGWALPDAGDYPVIEGKAATLLSKLAGLRAERPVTQTRDSHRRLKVAEDEFMRRIDLQAADGATTTLYIGSPAAGVGVHLRAAGHDEVYLASDLNLSELDAAPASWVDPLYFSLKPDGVISMTLKNANGEWAFAKGPQGDWSMQGQAPGETLDPGKVTELLSRVTSVSLMRPLGKSDEPGYGLAQPSVVVAIQAQGAGESKVHTLMFGAKEGDGSVALKSSDSPYYVRVAPYVAEGLSSMTRAGFLLQATATPGAGNAAGTPVPASQ